MGDDDADMPTDSVRTGFDTRAVRISILPARPHYSEAAGIAVLRARPYFCTPRGLRTENTDDARSILYNGSVTDTRLDRQLAPSVPRAR